MSKITLWLCVACLSLVACARPFVATTPSGFVELDESSEEPYSYDYRAAHPDGVVISVRVIRNRPEGDVAFWARALENELRLVKGYRLIGQAPVRNHDGLEGRVLEFGHDEGKTPHLYRVALFLHRRDLFVLEQGGTRDLVTAHRPELEQAVQNFSVKQGLKRFFSYGGAT